MSHRSKQNNDQTSVKGSPNNKSTKPRFAGSNGIPPLNSTSRIINLQAAAVKAGEEAGQFEEIDLEDPPVDNDGYEMIEHRDAPHSSYNSHPDHKWKYDSPKEELFSANKPERRMKREEGLRRDGWNEEGREYQSGIGLYFKTSKRGL